MKYDREWLQQYHDFQSMSDALEDLVTQVPIRDKFVISKAHRVLKASFETRINSGLSIERDWIEIVQLASLAAELIEDEVKRCAAYS